MSTNLIAKNFAQSPLQQELREAIANSEKMQLKGLVGSALSFVVADAFSQAENPFLLIFNDLIVFLRIFNDSTVLQCEFR